MGGGTLVDPEREREEQRAGQRAEPFEISQEAEDRQPEIQEASTEEQDSARLEADRATIEVIRRVEVSAHAAFNISHLEEYIQDCQAGGGLCDQRGHPQGGGERSCSLETNCAVTGGICRVEGPPVTPCCS